jgi:phosphate transport system protein
MNHLDTELQYLRELSIEMMELTREQLQKSKLAVIDYNLDMAEEIIRTELRVNALELTIEKECENIIALFQPVATDLRFVLSVFKSVSELERIADHADGISKMLLERSGPFNAETLKLLRIEEIYNVALDMFDNVITSLATQDSDLARKVFKKDKEINKAFRSSTILIGQEIKKPDNEGSDLLMLYSFEAKLERTGDLLTNVAEEIIFYLEAEVLKHRKKNKKILKRMEENQ